MNTRFYLYRTEEERVYLRKIGKLAAQVLDESCKRAVPGTSTLDLDTFAEGWIKDHGLVPTFKGYLGFPCTLCTSINGEVVHGIPNANKILREGDIISIDVGVTLKVIMSGIETNFIGDNAKTVPVGKVSEKAIQLMEDTQLGLEEGIKQCKVGNRISDVAKAIEKVSKERKYGLVQEFGGHGIGPDYHCAPFIPNYSSYFEMYNDVEIKDGMVLALEPMFNLGLGEIRKLKDGWTIVTKDNKLSAHYEHSLLITDKGTEILTLLD